jgi:uncharacterized protein (TIGR02145 family)
VTIYNGSPDNDGKFISATSDTDNNWRSPQNDNLWQGVSGINNPCPSGFRMPTDREWETERNSWISNDSAGAYGSPLKLVVAGVRYIDGSFGGVGEFGYYWSETVDGIHSRRLYSNSDDANTALSVNRARGQSVRCIQDQTSLIDCNGDAGGSAYTDNCGICVGGNTGKTACIQDCTGEWGGSAIENSCGCVGGNTGVASSVSCVTSAGQVWMDRNLGASQVATAYNDSAAYGDLYQWGRGPDGHEKRSSGLTNTISSSFTPGHDNFIMATTSPYDWLVYHYQNESLWQGIDGINNPCPAGFRLPMITEWQTEVNSWSSDDPTGAYGSPLKLVVGGTRGGNGIITEAGIKGFYWSSSIYPQSSRNLLFSDVSANADASFARVVGMSIRCIKN